MGGPARCEQCVPLTLFEKGLGHGVPALAAKFRNYLFSPHPAHAAEKLVVTPTPGCHISCLCAWTEAELAG